MPIYIYRCESCGVQFERHQSFSEEPLKRCPECNKNSLRKVLTPAGIVFKGSGWYATDHKSSSSVKRPVKGEGKDKDSSLSASSSESGSSSSSSDGPGSENKSEKASKSENTSNTSSSENSGTSSKSSESGKSND